MAETEQERLQRLAREKVARDKAKRKAAFLKLSPRQKANELQNRLNTKEFAGIDPNTRNFLKWLLESS